MSLTEIIELVNNTQLAKLTKRNYITGYKRLLALTDGDLSNINVVSKCLDKISNLNTRDCTMTAIMSILKLKKAEYDYSAFKRVKYDLSFKIKENNILNRGKGITALYDYQFAVTKYEEYKSKYDDKSNKTTFYNYYVANLSLYGFRPQVWANLVYSEKSIKENHVCLSRGELHLFDYKNSKNRKHVCIELKDDTIALITIMSKKSKWVLPKQRGDYTKSNDSTGISSKIKAIMDLSCNNIRHLLTAHTIKIDGDRKKLAHDLLHTLITQDTIYTI